MSAWALTTLVPYVTPTLFGLYPPYDGWYGYAHHVAVLWIAAGVVAVLLRTVYLCATVEMRHGLVWMTKILTDPFHDAKIHWKAPLRAATGRTARPDDRLAGAAAPAVGAEPGGTRARAAMLAPAGCPPNC